MLLNNHCATYFSILYASLFCIGVSSNLSQQKSPTAEIIGINFLRTIVPRKYMSIISAVGPFCCDKFEETPNEEVVNKSKLTKSYFSSKTKIYCDPRFATFWVALTL